VSEATPCQWKLHYVSSRALHHSLTSVDDVTSFPIFKFCGCQKFNIKRFSANDIRKPKRSLNNVLAIIQLSWPWRLQRQAKTSSPKIKELIENGFEFVCQEDDLAFFRKRK
jgi:hypothetical protein